MPDAHRVVENRAPPSSFKIHGLSRFASARHEAPNGSPRGPNVKNVRHTRDEGARGDRDASSQREKRAHGLPRVRRVYDAFDSRRLSHDRAPKAGQYWGVTL